MQHDPVAERHQACLATELARFQVLLLDDKEELVGLGVAIPFAWDGTLAGLPAGWDAVVTQGVADLDTGRRPTALTALSLTVAPARRGQGLSRLVLQALKVRRRPGRAGHAAGAGAPVGQEHLPLTPMERYVRWVVRAPCTYLARWPGTLPGECRQAAPRCLRWGGMALNRPSGPRVSCQPPSWTVR